MVSRLGVPDERSEVDGPSGEEEREDVGGGEHAEDDEGVGEVERRDGEQQPERVEREEGPEVEACRPVAPPQQVHALHRLAVHLEPRHAGATTARIGGETCGVAGGCSDRVSMRVGERGGGREFGGVYQLGFDGIGSAAGASVAVRAGGRRARVFPPPLLLLCLCSVVSSSTPRRAVR